MSIFVVPALVALIIKLGVMFVSRTTFMSSPYFGFMVLVFACHNLCEVLVFWEYFHGDKAEYVLRSYYVISLVSLLSIALYISSIVDFIGAPIKRLLVSLVSFVSLFIIFSDSIVAGSRSLGYVFTAVRGEYYGVFQLLSLAFMGLLPFVLYRGYVRAQNHNTQIRCAFMGMALVPHFLSVILVILIMNLGFQVNGAAIFPFATTLFLVIILASENQHKLTDIRRFIPFSHERRTSNEIMDIYSKYARDQQSYREAISEIEKLLVTHKYDKTGRNASSTAELMGMPRSSLYSLFNRLKIKK
ncbi:hypothetical protein NBRC116583_25550 [Arenicella sp. 4NH20-0111]|uniref:hypothetical protein n=1 Tax=Arenicella sp. 4NH20-0111 TaxID=3127648 RepID=UPI0031046519